MPIDKRACVVGDRPHITGTRIGVHHVAEKILYDPYSFEDVATDVYPALSEEDILDALEYVFEHNHIYHKRLREREQDIRKAQDGTIRSPTELSEDLHE